MTVIALFGATGRTGHRVLTRALAAGCEVRDPAKRVSASPAMTVIRGDVLDANAVERTVAGADVVLSLFGQVKGSPKTLQADGTQLIVDAMARQGVKRIIWPCPARRNVRVVMLRLGRSRARPRGRRRVSRRVCCPDE